MTAPATAEMCRIVVCGPDRQIEISVPAQVVVADLLPVLLQHLGDGLADTGLGHSGWILQRLGSPPLDEDTTVGDSGLVDGTVVHLRPRSEQIPPVHFDDSGWFLVRAVTSNPKTLQFASSGPYYVEKAGRPRISRASVNFFINWIDEDNVMPQLAEPQQVLQHGPRPACLLWRGCNAGGDDDLHCLA